MTTNTKPATVTVAQVFNPNCNSPQDPQHVWKVTKTVNTMVVQIGQNLDKAETQTLIDDGITVNVT